MFPEAPVNVPAVAEEPLGGPRAEGLDVPVARALAGGGLAPGRREGRGAEEEEESDDGFAAELLHGVAIACKRVGRIGAADGKS